MTIKLSREKGTNSNKHRQVACKGFTVTKYPQRSSAINIYFTVLWVHTHTSMAPPFLHLDSPILQKLGWSPAGIDVFSFFFHSKGWTRACNILIVSNTSFPLDIIRRWQIGSNFVVNKLQHPVRPLKRPKRTVTKLFSIAILGCRIIPREAQLHPSTKLAKQTPYQVQ